MIINDLVFITAKGIGAAYVLGLDDEEIAVDSLKDQPEYVEELEHPGRPLDERSW